MNRILIGLYEFDGPYSLDVQPLNQAGIIGILRHSGDDLEIVQLKATDDLRAVWQQLKRRYADWAPEELSMAIHYMPGLTQSERNRVLHDIFDEFEMAAAS